MGIDSHGLNYHPFDAIKYQTNIDQISGVAGMVDNCLVVDRYS